VAASAIVAALEVFAVSIPHNARYRNWAIAKATTAPADEINLVVKLTSADGAVGWGEVGRYYDGETPSGAHRAIRQRLAPAVAGQDAANPAALRDRLEAAAPEAPFARSAVEMAALDLAARTQGVPLGRLLGGRRRERIPICPSIGIKEGPEQAAEQAAWLRGQGYGDLKFKVGLDAARDRRAIELIRRDLGPGFRIRIDPNRAYGRDDALAALRAFEALGVVMVEQPVEPEDHATLRLLVRELTTPIYADERTQSGADVIGLAKAEAARGVMVKPARCGGLSAALEVATVAQAAGMGVCVGSLRELGLATAAFLHLAAALPRLDLSCNLAGPALFLEDDILTSMLVPQDGHLAVPVGPGLGVTVDEAKLRAHAARLEA